MQGLNEKVPSWEICICLKFLSNQKVHVCRNLITYALYACLVMSFDDFAFNSLTKKQTEGGGVLFSLSRFDSHCVFPSFSSLVYFIFILKWSS